MPLFTTFLEDLSGWVPSQLRRMASVVLDTVTGFETSQNILNLVQVLPLQFSDAVAEALREYIEEDWPIDTAAGWVLDTHWGPYHNLQRNGLSDADYRVFIHAKRLLNRSWGATDQALTIFRLLLPTSTLTFTPSYPKAWTVNITGVDMATAMVAVNFMAKKPSPAGGGFSVCGDNGIAVVVDPECFNYSSVYGVIGVDYVVTGFYSSVNGPGGGVQAGFAHAGGI